MKNQRKIKMPVNWGLTRCMAWWYDVVKPKEKAKQIGKVVSMAKTEAQRKAENKYKKTLKQWQARLTPEEFAAVEIARGATPRRKWLLQIAQEKLNKEN